MQEIKADPLIRDLLDLNERFKKARAILTNPSETAFYFVTIPQSLPISVVKRFIKMVRAFDIPVGGVIVNMVMSKESASSDITGYLESKRQEQHKYLQQIKADLGDYVTGYIPLYARDVVGLEDIKRLGEDLKTYRPEL